MSARYTTLATAVALAVAFSSPVDALTITRAFSGLWVDAAEPSRGLGAEVIAGATGPELHAYWFTRDAAGKPVWIRAQGPIKGARAVLDASVASASTPVHWGKVTASFVDCGHGTLAFQPDDSRQRTAPSNLVRAAASSADACTGGLSDDHVASNDVRIVQFLGNTGVVPAASGKLRFEDRGDRTDFKVQVEDLPVGTYSLRVAGTERAALNVVAAAIGTFAEAEFRSPVEPGKILLDFDPRKQLIEVVQGSTVFLARTFDGDGRDDHANPGGTFERYVLELETSNDGPQMRAVLDDGRGRSEFSVELEDFAVGRYTVLVNGAERGSIDVVAVEGGTEGEIEFRDPPEPGHVDLDFDPRGQSIAIATNGAIVLSGNFPSVPTNSVGHGGGNDDPPGDDHGGGGNDDPPGDDHGGGGSDDPPGDDHGGGGNDDRPGDDTAVAVTTTHPVTTMAVAAVAVTAGIEA
ncbi:MAG: hypothetical protein ACTHK2_02345 [Dokdonella sp.]|uniref:hypothetical protein n=1 Tax=Dokdonella sp. TaxID=2291710 RepID=UPI003F8014F6